jgi:hypothetical protein
MALVTSHITSHSSRTNNSWLFARTSLILANNHLPLNGALYAMNEVNITVVILILATIHLVCASVVFFLISKSINRLCKLKRNKYILSHIEKLSNHKLLVIFLPLIGPIVGFALINGLEVGIPEKGLKVNSPGDSNSISDGE